MNDQTAPKPREVSIQFSIEGRGSFSASGPDDLVFKALAEFKSEIAGTGVSQRPTPKPERKGEPISDDAKQDAPVHSDKSKDLPPLAPFVKHKAPKTNPEAVAAIAAHDYWVNGTTEFTIDSIGALWRDSGRVRAGNLGRDVDSAYKEGWLDRPERGQYRTNKYGRDFVENDLPHKTKA